MLQNTASDLGLHCLPMLHKKDARLKWVKKLYDACFKLVYFLCWKCLFLNLAFTLLRPEWSILHSVNYSEFNRVEFQGILTS